MNMAELREIVEKIIMELTKLQNAAGPPRGRHPPDPTAQSETIEKIILTGKPIAREIGGAGSLERIRLS